GQWALPDAWRAQHRSAHGRGTHPLRRRPPHPRLLRGRDHGAPPRRGRPWPPGPVAPRRPPWPPDRWAPARRTTSAGGWGPSVESVASRCQPPASAARNNGGNLLGSRRGSAPPRGIPEPEPRSHRWAWGASFIFRIGARLRSRAAHPRRPRPWSRLQDSPAGHRRTTAPGVIFPRRPFTPRSPPGTRPPP